MRRCLAFATLVLLVVLGAPHASHAQFGPSGPPPVGVATVERRPVVETNEFIGRIQSVEKVDLVARVTAFLQEIHFTEGAEVKKGDVLYVLEQPPFQADVAAKQAQVANVQALLRNATITLKRAQSLLGTPAGMRSTVDDALANQASQQAQLQAAQAQLEQSEINLAYTVIRAPISGRITRTNVTVGNVVNPSSGPLATIFSQDPEYVLFPVSTTAALGLRNHYEPHGGLMAAKIRLRLADGSIYSEEGWLDYVEPTVSQSTDTIILRARIHNPELAGRDPTKPGARGLVDGEFVTVILQAPEPVMALAIPRVAVLTDQQGPFVYVVGADKKAEVRRVTMGQSTQDVAMITNGLKQGEQVIVDGLQKVRPGAPVNPAPTAGSGPGKVAG
jgi:membrane fusion protein (multidrug efflux system)